MANTSFLTMFPFCGDRLSAAGGLDKAYLTDAEVDDQARTIRLKVHFPAMPSIGDIRALEERIAGEFTLSECVIEAEYPAPADEAAPVMNAPAGPARQPGKVSAPCGKLFSIQQTACLHSSCEADPPLPSSAQCRPTGC